MSEFRYRAVDRHNQPVEGTVQASSAAQVVDGLQQEGLQATAVGPVYDVPPPVPRKDRLTAADLALFNEQVLAIVKSGLPLGPSFEALARDVHSRRLRRVVEAIRADVEAGRSLSEALAQHPRAFSPVYLSLVRAGEEAGNLAASLEVLTAQSERNLDLKYRIQEAVAYPLLVTGVAVVLIFYFLLNVAPNMSLGVMGNGGPRFTRDLVKFGKAIYEHWGLALLVLAAVAGGVYAAKRLIARMPRGRLGIDTIKFRMPVYGPVIRLAAVARFARALGMLLKGRVPVPEAVRLAGTASGNALLQHKVAEAAGKVETGHTLADSLDEAHVFPETFLWLLRTGEGRGTLPEVMFELAESYERATARRSRIAAASVGPALTLAAAIVIMILIVIVYSPLIAVIYGG